LSSRSQSSGASTSTSSRRPDSAMVAKEGQKSAESVGWYELLYIYIIYILYTYIYIYIQMYIYIYNYIYSMPPRFGSSIKPQKSF
jgi:hypothetical protein